MGKPLVFVENFYSRAQFPGHTVSATEEPSLFEAYRVANGRRSPFDYSTTSSANIDQVYTSVCDRVRTASMLGLDRGHSHAGKLLTLDVSQDNFTTWERILNDITLPTATGPGNIDDALGVRTEEAAWLIRFPARSGTYWRTIVRAEGAGTKQKVVGLQLGMGWECEYFVRPSSMEGAIELVGAVGESSVGWRSIGTPTRRKRMNFRLQLADLMNYDQARYHLVGHFASGRPMWFVPDQQQAERAVMLESESPIEFLYPTDWGYQACQFTAVEHEPLRAL